MTNRARRFWELVALGIANGVLLGAGLAAAHRGHAVPVAVGAGVFITFAYWLSTRRHVC